MRRRAFTLVELLVVIGIIALLISILLPVLGRVRKQAEATECSANLHGMAQAWVQYCSTYGGVCPPGRLEKLPAGGPAYSVGDGADEYRPRWYELLGGVAKQYANQTPKATEDDTWTISNKWFLCPSVPEWINSRNYPYGYNFQFLGNARPRETPGLGGAKVWINYPVKQSAIKGSQTVMIADSMGTAATRAVQDRVGNYPAGHKHPSAVGNKGYLLDPPRMTGDSDRCDIEQKGYRSAPDPRHMGKVSVVFCDGHGELLTMKELGYAVNADGSVLESGANADGFTAHNMLFSGTGQDTDPPSIR